MCIQQMMSVCMEIVAIVISLYRIYPAGIYLPVAMVTDIYWIQHLIWLLSSYSRLQASGQSVGIDCSIKSYRYQRRPLSPEREYNL